MPSIFLRSFLRKGPTLIKLCRVVYYSLWGDWPCFFFFHLWRPYHRDLEMPAVSIPFSDCIVLACLFVSASLCLIAARISSICCVFSMSAPLSVHEQGLWIPPKRVGRNSQNLASSTSFWWRSEKFKNGKP